MRERHSARRAVRCPESWDQALAVGAGVAALLGVSLLNAARVQYPRAKRSPRFSGMYLLDDAVLVLAMARHWLVPGGP